MKDHAQFADNLALYAMDALDDPQEIAELQSHLSSCGECRRELEALRADTALLALSAAGPLPPQPARQRLLRAVAAEPRSAAPQRSRFILGRQPRWLSLTPVVVSAILAVISLGLMINSLRLRRINERLTAQYEQMKKDSALAREVMDMINDPRAVRMTLVAGQTHPQPQVKTIYKQDKGHILLMASNLQPIPDDKVYELWLIDMSGKPMPAGTFRIDPKGSALMMHAMESEGIQAKAFAITVEPAGGSQTPTMPMVLAPA